jgi:hypothetical protein
MRPRCIGLLTSLLTVIVALSASAQDRQPDPVAPSAALPANMPSLLTGKERLGPKWMDEQRIDNCKVPIDKRGTRPRSSTCPHLPVG